MLKKWFCFTMVAMLALPALAQYEDLKSARNEQTWLRFVLEHTDEWRKSLIEPRPDVAHSLYDRVNTISASTKRLAAINVPDSLKGDLQTALQGLQPVTSLSAKTMSDLSYLDEGGKKTVGRVRPAFDEARTRLDGIDAMVTTFFGQSNALARLMEAGDQAPDALASTSPCIAQRVDQLSRHLAPLVRERNSAVQQLSTALNNGLQQVGLGQLAKQYDDVAAIDASLEPLAAALVRVESTFTSKLDLSFRYWGATPEGRFGEVTVPVAIDSALLFNGAAATKETVKGMIPSSAQKFAQAYGLDWALEGIDQDLPEVTTRLRNDLDLLGKAKVDKLDDLPYLVSISVIGSVAGFGEYMDKYLPRPDVNAPNHGVLKVSAGFDYRNIDQDIAALTADNLRAACK